MLDKIGKKFQRVMGIINKAKDENKFSRALSILYHSEGHLSIGENCKNKTDDFDSPMVFSEVSARDPIFYR